MKFAICNETYQKMSWADTCAQVARAGYKAIEIAPFTLAPDVRDLSAGDRKSVAAIAHDNDLTVTGLHWLLVSPKGLSLTSDDSETRVRTRDYMTALVDFCGDVTGTVMVLGSPAQRRLAGDYPQQNLDRVGLATSRLIACLEPALKRAEDRGITICLEPLPAPEADFILTLAEAVAIIIEVGHPSLKTIFDVKSASSEAVPAWDLITRYAPYIAHVHANDANRRGPGFGPTDFVPIIDALMQAHYDGFVSVEVFDYTPDAETIASESYAYLSTCLAYVTTQRGLITPYERPILHDPEAGKRI